jgi:polyphosphate kinase
MDPMTAFSPQVRYINREASWIKFNARVLAEAENKVNPLFERLKFLAIFESNLDEFFMVRVSGLFEQEAAGDVGLTPDGLTPTQQIAMIHEMTEPMRQRANDVWHHQLLPALSRAGIKIHEFEDLPQRDQKTLEDHFQAAIFPLCTPLMLHPSITFPFISNRSLNLAVELRDDTGMKLARVKIPPIIPRLVPIPGRVNQFVLLENLIASQLDRLFPGVEVVGSHLFRVIRDADVEIREIEAADLIDAVEKSLKLRRFGDAVLLEVQPQLSAESLHRLRKGLELDESDVVVVDGLLGLEVLWEFARLDLPQHKFPPHVPYVSDRLSTPRDLVKAIKTGPVLVHHPYDGFLPVEQFVDSVATDHHVIGIKQTMYRVGSPSPIVQSLLNGSEAGKQVAVMVELKARFDESNNLEWARALERAGVHVTYGFSAMKVHCKLCLVVRKEGDGIHTYVHIGTGNYNPSTARLYTDLGLFTNDPDICQDATELFNYLTGYSKHTNYRKLLVAPLNLRDRILELIDQEIECHRKNGRGRIMFKLNSLVDPEVIDALYEASQAGVDVDLVVRGICCLRPKVKGLSDRIQVRSIVGRFLEHSRIYLFENAGEPLCYIGSADMMRRNLDRRIEVLAPVEDPAHIAYLRDVVIENCLRDTENSWELRANGAYRRVRKNGSGPLQVQTWLMDYPASRMAEIS